ELPAVVATDIFTPESDAAGDFGSVGKQPHNGTGGHRLARAGLSDQADRFAVPDRQADVTNDDQPAAGLAPQIDPEVLHLEERRMGVGHEALSRLERRSPSRLNAMTVITIIKPANRLS